jgi:hypothetical protein
MKIFSAIILLFIFFTIKGFSQIYKASVPYSIIYKLQDIQEFQELEEHLYFKSMDTINSRYKKTTFAYLHKVNFNPYNSGIWEKTPSGKVWRLGIKSKGAYSLYEIFGKFHLSQGVILYIYNSEKTDFIGGITYQNNNKSGILGVRPLAGETIIIELNIPLGIEDYGEIILTEVWHDYKNVFGKNELKSYTEEPEVLCNVDINCPIGAEWQIEKNAVCRILAYGQLCTGVLINNAANEKIPYLLTACHCIEDSVAAASSIFFFGYEKQGCNKPGNEKSFALSGSYLLATTPRLIDFSLVKLYQFPPAEYNPYFAGWDVSQNQPQKGVCIHHPEGSVKKISLENNPLTTSDFGEGFDTNSHWLVSKWEIGSTTGGSSGAPFFNEKHKIIGTLSGGDAKCENPVNDFFSKINLAWNKYPSPSNQLKYWLDPENTGTTSIDGYYPYEKININYVTLSNIKKDENIELNSNNLSWGVISGHNSRFFSQFAEKFKIADSAKIKGIYINIKDRYFSNIFSTFTIKIWKGSEQPEQEIYSQEVYYRSIIRSAYNYYYFDSTISVNDNFFAGYCINYQFPDTLKVNTAVPRTTGSLSTMFVYYDNAWHNIKEITYPSVNTSLAIGVITTDETDLLPQNKWPLQISPNPCVNYTKVDLPNDFILYSLSLSDLTGRKININYEKNENSIKLDVTKLYSGIYILDINSNKGRCITKFEKIKY